MSQKQTGKIAWTRPVERENRNERLKHILLRYVWDGLQKYSEYPNSGTESGND